MHEYPQTSKGYTKTISKIKVGLGKLLTGQENKTQTLHLYTDDPNKFTELSNNHILQFNNVEINKPLRHYSSIPNVTYSLERKKMY